MSDATAAGQDTSGILTELNTLTQGMDEADFARRHGRALWDVYGARLAPALRDGRLMRQDGHLYLTEHGMDVMNSVLVDAMGE